LLELAEASSSAGANPWVRVRHREGGLGWVRGTEVWGW
jgi:hypothetical protein